MKCDVVIIGAGPGGLHCGKILAASGADTLIIERRPRPGKKVCAGGITWRGLIKTVPEELIERRFNRQVITTRYQRTHVEETVPVVATVNRAALGTYMAERAERAGARIICGARAHTLEPRRLCYAKDGREHRIEFDYLVGADGSNSAVRKYTGTADRVPKGIGIQYVIDNFSAEDMLWNFDGKLFGSGYSWIFPHRDQTSIGAYIGVPGISAQQLKKRLHRWADERHIDISGCRFEADLINWDYRGWKFGHTFLVGDAAGLASPLTGEGINPAIVSGEAVARTIIEPGCTTDQLDAIIRRHRSHEKMLKTAAKSPIVSTILAEICAVLLRFKLVGFDRFEMA